jgi:hypothetical protein
MFGTAVPVHYYIALSEKMLTDGFFSRTICVEANRMLFMANELNEIVQTLYEQGRIEYIDIETKTKPAQGYRLMC